MPVNNPNDAGKTKEHFDVPGDERKEEKSGEYPYYMSYKSRSGHNFVFDDTQGNESVTLQHRGGSAVQMRSDGSLHITAHNGQYTVTFGENRMTISGAHDITVKGDCSLRVYGDYNVTCHKDYNLTVMGNFNMTAKNHNRHIRGNLDTQVKNETKKLEGSSATLAQGGIAKVAKGPVSVISSGGAAHMGGKEGLNMAVTGQGKMTFRNEQGDIAMSAKDGKMQVRADRDVNVKSLEGKLNMSAKSDVSMESTSGNAQLKAQSGNAGIKAMQAYVTGSTSVDVKGATSNHGNDAAELPNIDVATALFQRVAGAKANQPMEEPDHEQEVSNWV